MLSEIKNKAIKCMIEPSANDHGETFIKCILENTGKFTLSKRWTVIIALQREGENDRLQTFSFPMEDLDPKATWFNDRK